jgi:hypothetical protein
MQFAMRDTKVLRDGGRIIRLEGKLANGWTVGVSHVLDPEVPGGWHWVVDVTPTPDQAAELASLRAYTAVLEDDNAALLAQIGPYQGDCHACNIEAALGTEECPHPVDARVHTCKPVHWLCPKHGCPSLADDGDFHLCEACNAWWAGSVKVGTRPAQTLECGCVTCTCESPDRCFGCGAEFCAEHAPRGFTL